MFYKFDTIYEAKVIKTKEVAGERWPKYLVHYQVGYSKPAINYTRNMLG